ncbi:MAG: 2-phosphosulfolactate phosphatase [Candidatus Hodarchaeota archaeon]
MSSLRTVNHGVGPDALANAVTANHIVILVDVLRASSTIITALANGASKIIPVPTVEEARDLIYYYPDGFLAGERAAHAPAGFDYGNSPRSFFTQRIHGRPIILTTSNFTRTLGKPPKTATILVGAFLNIEHVAATARTLSHQSQRQISVISAGSMHGPALEDDFTSYHIISRIERPNDPRSYADTGDIARELLVSRHGSILVQAGYEDDIYFCAQPNRFSLTPILRDAAFVPFAPHSD